MNESDDPYQILGVSSDASDVEIKKAYRKLALKNHPDKQTTNEDKEKAQTVFAKIANAYEILSDPEEREQYDLRKKYGGAPGTRYTTTKSPGASGSGQPMYSGSPQYTTSSAPRTTRRTSSTTSSMPSGGGNPACTSYSQKNGKYTATVTREDGTTYTFMGSADGFQDPYEVFRKAFQDKTGEDLPDNMKPKTRTSTTSGSSPTMMSSSTPVQQSVPQKTVRSGTRTSITQNGNMKTITTTETLPDGRTRTSMKQVPIDTPTTNTTTTTQRRVVTPTPQTTTGTTTTKRMSMPGKKLMSKLMPGKKKMASQPTAMASQPMTMASQPTVIMNSGGGVQPMGRSMKTRTVQHDDGSIETITEVTETMSDGTTRTSSSSKTSAGTSNSSMPAGRRMVMSSSR